MTRWLFLIQVSRPLLWPVLPLVYAFGLRASGATLTMVALGQMLLLTMPMNLIGCGLNDIYDYESDRRCSRRRSIWGAVVRAEDRPFLWRACLAMIPVVVVGALLTQNAYNVAAAVALIIVAWLYSVPPVRLKERPPLDSLANGLGYFLLPLMMGYSLGADPATMPLRYYLLALAVCGIHALATAADYEADRAAGHRTFAVAFGRRTAAAFACAAFLLALAAGDFTSVSVRAFLALGAVAALTAALVPNKLMIATACSLIFGGFLLAAVLHIRGW